MIQHNLLKSLNKVNILSTFLTILPFASQIIFINRLGLFLIIFGTLISLVTSGYIKINLETLYLGFLFLSIACFSTLTDTFSIARFSSFLNIFIIFVLIICLPKNILIYEKIYSFSKYLLLIACFFGILQFFDLIDFGTNTYFFSDIFGVGSQLTNSTGKRITSFFAEPAGFGFFLSYFTFWSFQKKEFILSSIFFIFLFLTNSISSLVPFLFFGIFIFANNWKNIFSKIISLFKKDFSFIRITKIKITYLITSFFISILIFNVNFNPFNLISDINFRLSNLENLLMTAPFRINAPLCVLQESNSNLIQNLIGHGISSTRSLLVNCGYGRENADTTHLALTDVLYELGLIGLIIYLILIFLSISKKTRFSNKYIIFLLPLFLITIPYRGPQLFLPIYLLISIGNTINSNLRKKNFE